MGSHLSAAAHDLRPNDALVDRLVQVHDRLANDDLVGMRDGEVALEPLLRGQHVVGRLHGERRGIHVEVADHFHLGNDLRQLAGVADHGVLVAGALHPVADDVGLAGLDGLEHRGDVRVRPDAQALVLAVAQTLLDHLGAHDGVERADVDLVRRIGEALQQCFREFQAVF